MTGASIRNAGFVACMVGALVMVVGRFAPWAPVWLVAVGVAIIALGWGLFAWSMLQRWAAARASLEDTHG